MPSKVRPPSQMSSMMRQTIPFTSAGLAMVKCDSLPVAESRSLVHLM